MSKFLPLAVPPLSLQLGLGHRNSTVTRATVEFRGPAEKINITVPRLVLARIDEFAKKKGQSRSGFLVEAARTAMHA